MEEEVLIHKGENYKSKRTKPPIIRDPDDSEDQANYFSDDNKVIAQKSISKFGK